jgi:hypothetical protein
MFDVEIHVPVQELQQRMQAHGATASSRIRHVFLQSGVLRVFAEELQPSAIAGGQ